MANITIELVIILPMFIFATLGIKESHKVSAVIEKSLQKEFQLLAQANHILGSELYLQLSKSSSVDENILFSPFNIQCAFSMLSLGSNGTTEEQILDIFGGHGKIKNISMLSELFHKELLTLNSTGKDVTIEFANTIFLKKGMKVLTDFKESMRKDFFATSKMLDFSDTKKSAEIINDWGKNTTNGKIENIVSSDTLDENVIMVLASALYFKGSWMRKFDPLKTEKGTFRVSEGKTKKVDFMHMEEHQKVGYYKNQTILALPFLGKRFVMYFFAPSQNSTEGDLLDDLEKNLETEPDKVFKAINYQNFDLDKVILSIPKFKIENTIDLKDIVEKLGGDDIFDGDYPGITGSNDIKLSKAIHKSSIEVTETGAEASSMTAMIESLRSLPPPPLHLVFDSPFLFVLKDELSGLVLFQGRLSNPDP